MPLTDDDDKLLRDWNRFLTYARRAETLLVDGKDEDARAMILLVAGMAMGLSSRLGITFGDMNDERERQRDD